MKRLIALSLASAGLLLAAGCGKTDDSEIHADATCYCDYYGNGTTNYVVTIQYGRLKNDGSFRKAGETLTLDFIAPGDAERKTLPEGTYTLDTDEILAPGELVQSSAYTLLEYLQAWIDAGFSIDLKECSDLDLNSIAGYYGTAYYKQTNNKDGEAFPVSQATATVTRNGKNYLISATVTVNGEAKEFTYEGPIEISIQEPAEPLTEGFTAYYYGDYYNVSADNWLVRVLMEESEALILELLKTKGTVDDLPLGSFTVSRGMVPGDLISGVLDETSGTVDGSCVASWSNHLKMLIDDGNIELSRGEEEKMRLNYSLRGSDPIYGGEREGTFTGALKVVDCTVELSSMLSPNSDDNLKYAQYGSKKTLQKATRAHDRRRL